MEKFEIAQVDSQHQIQWCSYEWRADLTIADLIAAGLCASGPVGVYGKCVDLSYKINPGDRIECYQPLAADPKAARRARLNR